MEPHRVVRLGVGSLVLPLGLLQVATLGRSSQDSTGISTPIPKRQGCERDFMTLTPNTGTTADWNSMASVNGTQVS